MSPHFNHTADLRLSFDVQCGAWEYGSGSGVGFAFESGVIAALLGNGRSTCLYRRADCVSAWHDGYDGVRNGTIRLSDEARAILRAVLFGATSEEGAGDAE